MHVALFDVLLRMKLIARANVLLVSKAIRFSALQMDTRDVAEILVHVTPVIYFPGRVVYGRRFMVFG